MKDIRNIGIFAHVDAGKTTLSEQILKHCGMIREAGSVDRGTAHTDRLEIERRRGISIQLACASVAWKGVALNIIDTPGHTDFAAEVERAIWTIDGAVLLVNGAEGIQPQTLLLYNVLTKAGIPFLVFINKIDRQDVSIDEVIDICRKSLGSSLVCPESREQMMELLAETDESALTDYLDGNIHEREQMSAPFHRLVQKGEAHPILCGSALRDQGVAQLLDAIVDYLPSASGDAEGDFSGVVFAISEDRLLGRGAHVRAFSGTIRNRDMVRVVSREEQEGRVPQEGQKEKVSQIRSIPLDGKGEDRGMLRAGEIGAIYGIQGVRVGQILGDAAKAPRRIRQGNVGMPLLMAKATVKEVERPELLRALEALSVEDPTLGLELRGGDAHIRIMGNIQMEVLTETLASRFGLRTVFDRPNVIYRETIQRASVGFYAYTMPKPCWAVIKFQLEPLPLGSGVRYESVVPSREIMPRYQHQIEQALPLALRQGMLGWQVDDIKITLIGGEHHLIHTHPLDFILATPVALMDGLRRAGTVLLEPIVEYVITMPEASNGRVIRETVAMRGEIVESALHGKSIRTVIRVPLATSVDFPVRLASITGGRGAISMRLAGYRPCDDSPPPECPRQGVHPLDTAKYILAARNALGGGVFES